MVDIQEVFKEYERYKKNPKKKNKERLIVALLVLFSAGIKIIECCTACEFCDITGVPEKPYYCSRIEEYLDERADMARYRHENCPYQSFDHYLGLIDKLREPGELLFEDNN